jgi:hypothetical protein
MLIDRDDVPMHTFGIPELDHYWDLRAERLAGRWFRLWGVNCRFQWRRARRAECGFWAERPLRSCLAHQTGLFAV